MKLTDAAIQQRLDEAIKKAWKVLGDDLVAMDVVEIDKDGMTTPPLTAMIGVFVETKSEDGLHKGVWRELCNSKDPRKFLLDMSNTYPAKETKHDNT